MESRIRPEIERATYDEFLALWDRGAFENQRLGQAFYNHFRLHRLSDQKLIYGLYESDGKKAMNAISEIFQIR
ncbi:hypothetical protein BK660_16030 [Pseudomonas brassicacearum]|uniref:Uncharacterized protein n=1 Tax=Pseudomonas brassicacearum TaxID=930166 RepID=A0A423I570_9PSED|nr:hypothetical protein [Pseudomonas brassicacearum]RON20562.1 hypothetical protein BK660_16030 [Pseudomonas brassicacearum]